MKRVILFLCMLAFSMPSFAQGIIGMISRSEEFFKLLSEENYSQAYSFFDANFKAKVSEDKIKQTWEQINVKFGQLETVAVISSKTEGDFFVVNLEGKFTKESQNFLLAFNKAQEMVGFFIQPVDTKAVYSIPKYVDTTLIQEKEIFVKTPGHSLVGVLTFPKGLKHYPVVVLVHGSGPQDMDETYGPNKPFKDIALGLASKGIATVRYVKRTTLYRQEFVGSFTVKEEVLDDAIAALALARAIPEADPGQVYLLGHSLGGMLAPRLAAVNPELAGLILLAAPARKLTDLIVDQNKFMFDLAKDSSVTAKAELDSVIRALDVSRITATGNMAPDSVIYGLPVSYWIDLNLYNQVEAAKKLVRQRFFIAQGGNDFQVSVSDYELWDAALRKRKNVSLKLYPELNHMMIPQKDKTDVQQYELPGNVSQVLITDIANWIKSK